MDEFNVSQRDLATLETIATVSSWETGKTGWSRLSIFYRPFYQRPIVAVSEAYAVDDPEAYEAGREKPRTFHFKFVCVGTIERALRWFDDTSLADSLAATVGDWKPPPPIGRSVPIMAPGERIQLVGSTGYRGTTLTGALEWLYPDAEMAGSMLGRPMRLERDFGIAKRNVLNAMTVEHDDGERAKHGPWVAPFLAALKFFDRAAWRETITHPLVQPSSTEASSPARKQKGN